MVNNNIKNKMRRNGTRKRIYAIEIDDDNADTIDFDDVIGNTGENAQDADSTNYKYYNRRNSNS